MKKTNNVHILFERSSTFLRAFEKLGIKFERSRISELFASNFIDYTLKDKSWEK